MLSVFRERKYRKIQVKKKKEKKKKERKIQGGRNRGNQADVRCDSPPNNEEKLCIFQGAFHSGVLHLKSFVTCPLAHDYTTD